MVLEQIGGDLIGPFAGYEAFADRASGFFLGALAVYLIGRLLFLPGALRVVRARNRRNPTVLNAAETYLNIAILALAALAGVIGAGYGGVLTSSAVVIAAITLVLGVAGQEVIGSLVSGLFLIGDPDFNVGDWIVWSGGEGVVETIDFRVTRVRTLDNETVTVPNTELTGNAIIRPYGRKRFRVTERVDVAYDDDAELALRELVEVARADDRVLADPAPNARIVELAGESVGLQAEFWVEDPINRHLVEIRSDFRRRVKARFDEAGLTLGPLSTEELSGRVAVDVNGER